ncbi:single-stranded DNA-binding protein, partial [Streptococcus suis]
MYNKTILICRLTAQPELTQTTTGKNLTRVTVAVNR